MMISPPFADLTETMSPSCMSDISASTVSPASLIALIFVVGVTVNTTDLPSSTMGPKEGPGVGDGEGEAEASDPDEKSSDSFSLPSATVISFPDITVTLPVLTVASADSGVSSGIGDGELPVSAVGDTDALGEGVVAV